MKLVKTFVLEDDELFLPHLIAQLNQISGIEIVGTASDLVEAKHKIEQFKPDLLLFDVEIGSQTSFDLLADISPYPFHLIFISSFEEYALKAIKWRALDYLLKPFSFEDLKNAIEKVMQNTHHALKHFPSESEAHNSLNRLTLKTQHEIYFVDPEDVLYCQSDGNYTTFFLNDGSKLVVTNLIKHYDDLLQNNGFFRIHKSYLVQLKQIKKFNKSNCTIQLNSGDVIDVAKRKKEELLQKMTILK